MTVCVWFISASGGRGGGNGKLRRDRRGEGSWRKHYRGENEHHTPTETCRKENVLLVLVFTAPQFKEASFPDLPCHHVVHGR